MILAMLVVVGGILSSLGVENKLALTGSIRATALAPFLATHSAFARRGELAARVKRLEMERDRLSRQTMRDAHLEAENERLRGLLQLPERMPGVYLVAELVPGRPSVGDSHTFLVRAGADRSLSAPAAVGVPAGLLGVVRSVASDHAFGQFWTHPDFRVSVRAEGTQATGIVRAMHADAGETLMLLDGVPFQTVIPPGATLVTAGVAGVYPPGVPVGEVLAEAEYKSGWSRSYLVEPAVRPAEADVVLVWRRPLLLTPTDGGAGRDTDVTE
jgi:rod shape-determining protein MreC